MSSTERSYWLIQPLLDAGMDLDLVRVLVFRLAFDSVINGGCPPVATVTSLVGDQPDRIQVAWSEMVARMIALDDPAERMSRSARFQSSDLPSN